MDIKQRMIAVYIVVQKNEKMGVFQYAIENMLVEGGG